MEDETPTIEMTGESQTFVIRPAKRTVMMRRQVSKALDTLRAIYAELNPADDYETHKANPRCQEVWDSMGCLDQTLMCIDEIDNNEEDWSGVKEVPFEEE